MKERRCPPWASLPPAEYIEQQWRQLAKAVPNQTGEGWYADYLCSLAWRERRAVVLILAHRRCIRCKRPAQQVHHTNYDRLGRESLADLEPLCNECHELEHRINGDSQQWSLREVVDRVIQKTEWLVNQRRGSR